MKIMVSVISVLIILSGVLPFLGESGLNILPSSIPTTGWGYSLIIIFIGAAGLIYGIVNGLLMGIEKFVLISVAIMTILGGILPFISSLVSLPLPVEGVMYSGLIIIIGLIGLVYGVIGIG